MDIMNRRIARQLAEDKLKELISGDKGRIRRMFNRPEHEYLVKDGVEYEVTMYASYDDETKKLLKIAVDVADGGLCSVLRPVRREAFVNAEDVRNSPASSE